MCQQPNLLPNGQLVACRKCWQCVENRTNDWVGRCIAESKTAEKSHFITLTYGRLNGEVEHHRARVLTYSDVQMYIKRLRNNGYPVRYIVVGEYGSKKGRCHWHLILYWQGAVPPHVLNKRFHEPHWHWGFSRWEPPGNGAVRYAIKYMYEDAGKEHVQVHMAMSKKPPLGSEYFKRLAQRYVDAGLTPGLYYWFDDIKDKHGKKIKFKMSGVTAESFLKQFVTRWYAKHGTKEWPHSDVVEAFLDKQVKEDLERPFERKPMRAILRYPSWVPPDATDVEFSEVHNTYVCKQYGVTLYWGIKNEEQREWQEKAGRKEAMAQAQRQQQIEAQSIEHAKQHAPEIYGAIQTRPSTQALPRLRREDRHRALRR